MTTPPINPRMLRRPPNEPHTLSDERRYEASQAQQERFWEGLCRRCGACCGLMEGDPCEELEVLENGLTRCRVYEHRFGWHRTRSGRWFRCVPLREILHMSWTGDRCCGYKRYLKRAAFIQNGGEDDASRSAVGN